MTRQIQGLDKTHDTNRRIVQIATVGEESEGVLAGLRNVPANKLVLICYGGHKDVAKHLSVSISEKLKLDVSVYDAISREHSYESIMGVFSAIVSKNMEEYDEFLLNISSGDKMICIAASTAAFVLGIKVFYCKRNECVMLPPLKLSYPEMISSVKLSILSALDKAGGDVESLDELTKLTGHDKPLLSYHIHGTEDARGLIELGLVKAVRHSRGKSKVTLTALGKILLVEKTVV